MHKWKGEFNYLEDSACHSETRLVNESLNLTVIAVVYEVKDKQSHRKNNGNDNNKYTNMEK